MRYWDGREWTAWVADDEDAYDETASVIVVRRRPSWAGSAMTYRVLIDGQLAGRVANGETRTFFVRPGPHRVRVKLWYQGSRDLEVSSPPVAELRCGPRGGFIGSLGLALVQPRRSLALETDSDSDGASVLLTSAGVLTYIALLVAVMIFSQWLVRLAG